MLKRVILSLIALVVLSSTSFAEVHFKELSFDAAKKLAAKEKKQIMIDFYTEWCGWCKVLDRNTYSNEKVGSIADAKFISIKIDAEKGEGIALAKQYQISGYPTIMFFSADGKEIDRVVGYQDAQRFQRSLNLAASGGTKSVLAEVSANKDLKDPQKFLIAAEYYEEQHDEAKALQYFQSAAKLDAQNEKRIKEEADFHAAFLTPGDGKWKAIEAAVMQYPDRPEGQQATMVLLQHTFETEHPESDVERLLTFWLARHPDDVNVMNYFAWGAAQKGILLDRAEEMASRAVSLAQTTSERASIMDTRAEVLFKRQRVQDAVNQEVEAIKLLDPKKDKKLFTDLSAQKAKFESAMAPQSAGSNGGVADPSAPSAQ
jgi:thioredoxin-related protein